VTAIYQPDGVTPVDSSQVPRQRDLRKVAQVSDAHANLAMPIRIVNNYQTNFRSPISANQGDVRLDETNLRPVSRCLRASVTRTGKSRPRLLPPALFTYCAEAGSPLQGGYNTPEIDEGLTFAHNYVFTPQLLNEFRAGYNAQHTSETQSYSTNALLAQTGINVPQPGHKLGRAPQY